MFQHILRPQIQFATETFLWLQKLINQKCRKLPKHVAFYTVDCRGSCGEIFVYLKDYKYSKVINITHLTSLLFLVIITYVQHSWITNAIVGSNIVNFYGNCCWTWFFSWTLLYFLLLFSIDVLTLYCVMMHMPSI